jgi:hypothetical protein
MAQVFHGAKVRIACRIAGPGRAFLQNIRIISHTGQLQPGLSCLLKFLQIFDIFEINHITMRAFFRAAGLVLVIIIVTFLIIGLATPREISIERSTRIKAPREVVWNQVSRFENWNNWSPFYEMDTAMQVRVEGPDGKPGSAYHWKGAKSGEGLVKNTAIQGDEMRFDMEFLKPLSQKADGWLRVQHAGEGETEAVWGFKTRYPYPLNGLVHLLDINSSLTENFDRSLYLLKEQSETRVVSKQ